MASRYVDSLAGAFRTIEKRGPNRPRNWSVSPPNSKDRICSDFPGNQFAIYEYTFKDVRFRLPFFSFQMALLAKLTLAPSQLHPNNFSFMRPFEIMCDYLHIRATVPLFLRCFRIQWSSTEGQYSWVSFKNTFSKCTLTPLKNSKINIMSSVEKAMGRISRSGGGSLSSMRKVRGS